MLFNNKFILLCYRSPPQDDQKDQSLLVRRRHLLPYLESKSGNENDEDEDEDDESMPRHRSTKFAELQAASRRLESRLPELASCFPDNGQEVSYCKIEFL